MRTDLDLVLHLPLRYEDETHLTRLRDALPGQSVQVEVEVVEAQIQFRPKRILVCRTRDGDEELTLRFFHFYPSQLRQFAAGVRLRVMGEIKRGFFGTEMIHPRYSVLRGAEPLPEALTPVYPTTAGLAQHTLRKLIERALTRDGPRRYAAARGRGALEACRLPRQRALPAQPAAGRAPGRAAGAHAPGLAAHQVRRAARAAAVHAPALPAAAGGARTGAGRHRRTGRSAGRCPAIQVDARPGAGAGGDPRRSGQASPHAAAAAGRRGQRQDHRRCAGRLAGGGGRLPGCGDGAHRDPGRAASRQVQRLAGPAGRRRRVADRQPDAQGQARGARARGRGRGGGCGRHPRAVPGAGRVPAAGSCHRRRAASLRRASAPGLAPQGNRRRRGYAAASAHDERHADPAHPGHELLCRSGRLGDRPAAAGTHAGGHQAGCRHPPRRGHRAGARRLHGRAPGLLGVPAHRGVGGVAAQDRHRDLRDAHADLPGAGGGSGARAPEQQREDRRDGAVQRRRDPAAGGHHRDRGRGGRAATPR